MRNGKSSSNSSNSSSSSSNNNNNNKDDDDEDEDEDDDNDDDDNDEPSVVGYAGLPPPPPSPSAAHHYQRHCGLIVISPTPSKTPASRQLNLNIRFDPHALMPVRHRLEENSTWYRLIEVSLNKQDARRLCDDTFSSSSLLTFPGEIFKHIFTSLAKGGGSRTKEEEEGKLRRLCRMQIATSASYNMWPRMGAYTISP
ncbi:hypothetical protein HZH68_001027 [Vespula germanica]|uniref:Uncharacterized protein n=1 Tax=Vespula germanica TaxID=30212 RepID=A0A834NVA5_VESGE|nr:hypothetical protein HZH68_001027 [Vespula germanica]